MPKIAHVSLHPAFRLRDGDDWTDLRSLRCGVNNLGGLESLLRAARSLQHLECEWGDNYAYDPDFDGELIWPNPPVHAALSAIPDVHITAVFEPLSVQLLFRFFASSPRPHLLLDFVYADYTGPLTVQPCIQLSSATRLAMYSQDRSIFIVPEDGSGRIVQIALKDLRSGGPRPVIDWGLILSLNSLNSLYCDASLWTGMMGQFPQSPLLANVALKIRQTGDVHALLSHGPVPHVPQGAALSLTSEAPIAVTGDQVAALTGLLGVTSLTMTGGVYQE
ncbi:hypothetical protein AURDEDRAFT_114204 [Auricularia subglabra TFB-10046 SS5]|nr:hypothetical protein AURDEDRAFT_114204 [Auricularia subglabra TFB-10046 SS5]